MNTGSGNAEAIKEAVARSITPRLERLGDMSRAHVPLDPDREHAGVTQDVLAAKEELEGKLRALKSEDGLLIDSATKELCQIQAAQQPAFFAGDPLTQSVSMASVATDPQSVERHVAQVKTNLLAITKSVPLETKVKPMVATATAILLAVLAGTAGVMPLVQKSMMQPGFENADMAAIPTATWALFGAYAAALVIAGLIGAFLLKSKATVSPTLIGLALVFLIELEAFPAWSLAIKIINAVGVGVALFLVEFGAGSALKYAWLRWGKRSEIPLAQGLLELIETREAARGRYARPTELPTHASLVQVAVLQLTERVDRELAPTRAKVTAVQQFVHSAAPSGSLFEAEIRETNLPVLEEHLNLCHAARDKLLELAGLRAGSLPPQPSPQPSSGVSP